jgi:hypothetical protein
MTWGWSGWSESQQEQWCGLELCSDFSDNGNILGCPILDIDSCWPLEMYQVS